MKKDTVVFVGVVKDVRDLRLILREGWYRVPVAFAPKRPVAYLAFYQPAVFGARGKCIRYYAQVRECRTVLRRTLLPDEPDHPRAGERYVQFYLGSVRRLRTPVRNIIPRRVSFGYTTLHRLRTARDILQLYRVAPIEQIMVAAMRRAGIRAVPEITVTRNGRRVRVDFAIRCRKGSVAVECDNIASHRSPAARARDRSKSAFLARRGWRMVRLTERAILSDPVRCIVRIRAAIHTLGGQ